MANIVEKLAAHMGLAYAETALSAELAKGTAAGMRDGFILGVGAGEAIAVVLRFESLTLFDQLKHSYKDIPEIKKAGKGDLVMPDEHTLVWSFSKPMRPNAEVIAAGIDALIAAAAPLATLFKDGKCEECTNSVTELTLINGLPNLICESCKLRVSASQQMKAEEYERSESNPLLGFLGGLPAALALGVLAGLVMYWDISDNKFSPKLFIALTLVIGVAAAWVVKRLGGRITPVSAVVATLCALAGKVAADVLLFIKLYAGPDQPVDANLILGVIRNLHLLKWDFDGFTAVADAVCVLFTAAMLYGMRPGFPAVYTSLGPVVRTTSGKVMAASAGK